MNSKRHMCNKMRPELAGGKPDPQGSWCRTATAALPGWGARQSPFVAQNLLEKGGVQRPHSGCEGMRPPRVGTAARDWTQESCGVSQDRCLILLRPTIAG